MSDLIERLRTEQCRLNFGCNALDICACTKMDEAADALEAAYENNAKRGTKILNLQARIAELEWNYEAACNTLEVREKEIEQLDAALAEIIKECEDDSTLGYHDWIIKRARKARAGDDR